MNLTMTEGMEFMYLLEKDIEDLKQKYDNLSESIARCRLPKTNFLYKESNLTVSEMKELRNSFKERQHKQFILWYTLTQKLKANHEPYSNKNFQGTIIGEARSWDIIDKYKNEKNRI